MMYMVTVVRDVYEEALKKADDAYMDADFGEAKDIDGEKIIVEDETGNYVCER